MNYEDRTDLSPPEEVVSAPILARLQELSLDEVSRLMAESVNNPGSVAVSSAAVEAIVRRAAEDTGPEQGAPPAARAVEVDAMMCGYRFGVLALGSSPVGESAPAAVLYERAEGMYLYDLIVWGRQPDWDQGHLQSILARGGVAGDFAMEEAVGWAWAFGLGVAVVEADLAPKR